MQYSHINQPLYGVQQGVEYGQNARVDELNTRIQSRYFPDHSLPANFDPRPVPTKQTLFPIINLRKDSSHPILPAIHHYVETNFNPGTARAPPSGYFANVDTETILRNQTTVLQHGADQGVYVPSSKSDLYNVHVISRPTLQPFPELFKNESLKTYIPDSLQNSSIGKDRFSNHTRTQLRSL
jgi:hypothetical protein